MMNLLKKIRNYIHDFYSLNSDDVFIFSYPKSGNTRIRMAIAYYGFIKEDYCSQFDFDYLNSTQVEFGQGKINEVRKKSPFKNKGLFIKTHKIFDIKFLSKKNKIVYVSRPSLETLISYHEYKISRNNKYNLNFNEFLNNKKMGIAYFLKHLNFGRSIKALHISYFDLINSPKKTIKLILDYSNYDYNYDLLKIAIANTEREKALSFLNRRDSKDYKFSKKKDRTISDYFDNYSLRLTKPLEEVFDIYKGR